MGHNGSPYDDVIHVALIVRSRVANYQLPTSSACTVGLVLRSSSLVKWLGERVRDRVRVRVRVRVGLGTGNGLSFFFSSLFFLSQFSCLRCMVLNN